MPTLQTPNAGSKQELGYSSTVMDCSQEQHYATWTGSKTADAEPMAQDRWALAFGLALMKMRLDLFHGGIDGDVTLGTQGQP